MFTTLIAQPIFNVLVLIYALLPGHNFGFALIIFTVLARFAMWPLVKKQLHQAKAMRALQPQLKKLKQSAKGNKQKESQLMMELYKENGINPFGQIGLLLAQLPVFIALYSGINRIVNDNNQIISFSYGWIQNLPWLQKLAADVSQFDNTLFGIVDLNKPAQGPNGWYIPGLIIVLASAALQYLVSKQLAPNSKDSKSLRSILNDAKEGKTADQSDISAAVGNNMLLITPVLIAVITIRIPAALALYLLVSSIVAYFQQRRVLGQDEVELEALADGESVEATIIQKPKKPTQKKTSLKRKKRRK